MSFSIVTTSFGIAEKPQTKCSSCQKNSVRKLARATIKKLHPYIGIFVYFYIAKPFVESLVAASKDEASPKKATTESISKIADLTAAVFVYDDIKEDVKYVKEKLGSVCSYFLGAENEENQEQEIAA